MSTAAPPRHWERVSLMDVAAPIPNAIVDGPFGSSLKLEDYVPEGVPVLQGKNITDDTFRWFDVRFISSKKAHELRRSSVRVGDILIIKIGSIGYSAVLDDLNGFDHAIIPANLAKVTPDLTKVDIRYLYRWLTSKTAKQYFNAVASKTAQPALSLGKIKDLPVPLPPLPEQQQIAEILDKADAIRVKRRAALAQLDTLTQSIFLDMFGDPATNPKGWPTSSLDALGRISTGKTPPTTLEGMFGGDIPFATPGDLDSGLEYTQRTVTQAGAEYITIVRPGSALVGCIGNIGKMAKTPVRCAFNQQINAVEWSTEIDDDYGIAALAFARAQMFALSSSTTVPILNKSSFSKVRISVPPLSIQRDFSRRVGKCGEIRQSHKASLGQIDELFASLQDRAFIGAL